LLYGGTEYGLSCGSLVNFCTTYQATLTQTIATSQSPGPLAAITLLRLLTMNESLEFYEAFFQKQTQYYLNRLKRYKEGDKFTFNVFAFFFGIFWFTYRKMYIEAVLIIVFIVIEAYLENLTFYDEFEGGAPPTVRIIGTIAVNFLIGFVANYLYLRKAIKTVNRIGAHRDGETQLIMLKRKGGVSFIILLLLMLAVLSLFIYNNYLIENGS
jgi:hypothetical protein